MIIGEISKYQWNSFDCSSTRNRHILDQKPIELERVNVVNSSNVFDIDRLKSESNRRVAYFFSISCRILSFESIECLRFPELFEVKNEIILMDDHWKAGASEANRFDNSIEKEFVSKD